MASHKMSEENLEKKMQSVSNTQDSIQSLSLWLIHHKPNHKRIVDVWLQTFKKSHTKHQLTLFNLCNDVVQNGKRKKAQIYLESFKEPLKDAVATVRGKNIVSNVERILKIWNERNIFPKAFVEELSDSINKKAEEEPSETIVQQSTSPAYTPSKITDEEKILAEFKPQTLIERINAYKRLEGEVELKGKQLNNLKLDASSVEAVKQLKDRAHGKQFIKQFEDSCAKLENYMTIGDKKLEEEKSLIDMLVESEVFYDEQFREAKIVANAYKNFGNRINNLRKKLDDMIKSLPSPVPSPSYDAPSPGNTPPLEQIDNTEAVDMDLDDDDANTGSGLVSASAVSQSDVIVIDGDESYEPSELYSPTKPKFTGPTALDSRITSMIPSLPSSTTHSTLSDPRAKNIKQINMDNTPVYNPPTKTVKVLSDSHTASREEGSSTPVMDEKEDSPPSNSHQNPIDFLTQILAKTTKTSQPNSNFLQNLSLLTNTVKSQFQQQKESTEQQQSAGEETGTGSPRSWSEWKAQNTSNETITPPNMNNSVTPHAPSASAITTAMQSIQSKLISNPALYSHPHVPTESVQSVPGLSTTALISPPVSSHPPNLPPTPPIQPPIPPQMPGFPPPQMLPQTQPPPPPVAPNWIMGTQNVPPPPAAPSFPPQQTYIPSNPQASGFQGDPNATWNQQQGGWTQSTASNVPVSQSWPQNSSNSISDPPSPNWPHASGPPPVQNQNSLNWNAPPNGDSSSPEWSRPQSQDQTSPTWGHKPQAPEQLSPTWHQQQSYTEDDPWSQHEEPSVTNPALPPPPKGILRNRRESSLREIPITPSVDDTEGGPKPPVQPPSPIEGKNKFLKRMHDRGGAMDDHREFHEKLKRKTTNNKGGNLVSPPVIEDTEDDRFNVASVFARKPRSNLTTITPVEMSEETSNKNKSHGEYEGTQNTMQIEKVQVERRKVDKSDDIRYSDGAIVDMEPEDSEDFHLDYDHGDSHDYRGPPSHRENFEPRFRGPRPPFRPPPPGMGSRHRMHEPFWRRDAYGPSRRPPPPFRDHYDPYRRPRPRF